MYAWSVKPVADVSFPLKGGWIVQGVTDAWPALRILGPWQTVRDLNSEDDCSEAKLKEKPAWISESVR